MTERRERLTGALMVAIAATAFSGKGVIIKLAYRYETDAVTLLALRMISSAPLFALLLWWAARHDNLPPLSRPDLRNTMLLGLVGYWLASYFDFVGLESITASLERLLLFVHPTFVVILSAILFKRSITSRDAAAIVLSYVGIALAVGHDLATQPGNVALGSAWVLLAALLYALFLVGSGRIVGRVGSLRFAGYAGLASCAAVVLHFLVVRDGRLLFQQPAPVYWLAILMAAVSTVLPILLTTEGVRRIGASHASIISSVGPVATIFLAFLVLGEAITGIQLVGAGLVMAGVLAISLARK